MQPRSACFNKFNYSATPRLRFVSPSIMTTVHMWLPTPNANRHPQRRQQGMRAFMLVRYQQKLIFAFCTSVRFVVSDNTGEIPVSLLSGKALGVRSTFARVVFASTANVPSTLIPPCERDAHIDGAHGPDVWFSVNGVPYGTAIRVHRDFGEVAMPEGWVRLPSTGSYVELQPSVADNAYTVLLQAAVDDSPAAASASYVTVDEVLELWRVWQPVLTALPCPEGSARGDGACGTSGLPPSVPTYLSGDFSWSHCEWQWLAEAASSRPAPPAATGH